MIGSKGKKRLATEIHGFCDLRFLPLRDAFAANFADGLEIGASLAATHRGRVVADMWAGFADLDRTRLWAKDTIVPVASTTKIMMMIAALIAIDRGLLDLDAPVAQYWPAFAQGGKGAVTVRDALTHQAGVPGFETPLTNAEVCDWNVAVARVAAEPHWFAGEQQICYHAQTYGFLVGELIRLVDGRRPRQFLREEIFEKIGADFQLGLTDPQELARMALVHLPPGAFSPDIAAAKVLNSIDLTQAFSWERCVAEIPSGGGIGTARGVALACAIVANGGELGGVRFLSPAIVALAGAEHAYGRCPYLGGVRLGLGFGLDSKEFPAPTPTSMHWGGYGGSWALADPRAAFSLGYAPNNWVIPPPDATQLNPEAQDPRLGRLTGVLRDLLPSL